MMSEEKKLEQIEYLRSQRDNPTGNYRRYLVGLYNYFKDCMETSDGITSLPAMVKAAYGDKPDHMAYTKIKEYKKTLTDLGYIRNVKKDDGWHTYVVKDLDF